MRKILLNPLFIHDVPFGLEVIWPCDHGCHVYWCVNVNVSIDTFAIHININKPEKLFYNSRGGWKQSYWQDILTLPCLDIFPLSTGTNYTINCNHWGSILIAIVKSITLTLHHWDLLETPLHCCTLCCNLGHILGKRQRGESYYLTLITQLKNLNIPTVCLVLFCL